MVVKPPPDEESWGLTRLAIRELDLSAGGGWSALWAPREVCDELQIIRKTKKLAGRVNGAQVAGHNVLIMQPPVTTAQAIGAVAEALERDPLTRAVVVCRPTVSRCWFDAAKKLCRVSLLMEFGGGRGVGGFGRQQLVRGSGVAVAIAIGVRLCHPAVRIDYDDSAREMDLQDRGAGSDFDLIKWAVSFTPCPRPKAIACGERQVLMKPLFASLKRAQRSSLRRRGLQMRRAQREGVRWRPSAPPRRRAARDTQRPNRPRGRSYQNQGSTLSRTRSIPSTQYGRRIGRSWRVTSSPYQPNSWRRRVKSRRRTHGSSSNRGRSGGHARITRSSRTLASPEFPSRSLRLGMRRR